MVGPGDEADGAKTSMCKQRLKFEFHEPLSTLYADLPTRKLLVGECGTTHRVSAPHVPSA